MKNYSLALHIFRRDLRLQDNTALLEALKSSQSVIPGFIFDKRQIENNPYKSNHCIQFMIHSLLELNNELNKKISERTIHLSKNYFGEIFSLRLHFIIHMFFRKHFTANIETLRGVKMKTIFALGVKDKQVFQL